MSVWGSNSDVARPKFLRANSDVARTKFLGSGLSEQQYFFGAPPRKEENEKIC